MFNKLVSYFRNQRTKRRIVKIAKFAYSLIFSEEFDFMIDKDIVRFQNKIEGVSNNAVDLFQNYSIINLIIYDRTPIESLDIELLILIMDGIKIKEFDNELIRLKTELEIVKLKMNLLIIDAHIKTGKKESTMDKYSLKGMIYGLEEAKKSPVSSEDLKKVQDISSQLKEIDEKLNFIDKQNQQTN